MFDICEVLLEAKDIGASDVYLKAGIAPRFRRNGKIEEATYRSVTVDDMLECLLKITDIEQRNRLDEQGECCFSYEESPVGRYRVTVFKSGNVVSIVFHVVQPVSMVVKMLESQYESVQEIANKRKGLVLFAGNAGSGRTGAMAAVVDEINKNHPVHIMTMEDPIEILHASDLAIVNQRELGIDYVDKLQALDGAMKESVDVLMFDGNPDRALISKICQISAAGPLVLASVYGSSFAEVISNITALFGVEEKDEIRKKLSEVLKAVVICTWMETTEGQKAQWDVVSVDASVKNQIRNSL